VKFVVQITLGNKRKIRLSLSGTMEDAGQTSGNVPAGPPTGELEDASGGPPPVPLIAPPPPKVSH